MIRCDRTRVFLGLVVMLLACCVADVAAAQQEAAAAPPAAAPAADASKSPALAESYSRWDNRALGTILNVLEARAELQRYDELVASTPHERRTEYFYDQLAEMRGDICYRAYGAYFICGPLEYSTETAELAKTIWALEPEQLEYLEYPPDLQSLVDCGILSHLPEWPNPGGLWLSAVPEEAPPAGSLLYIPIRAKKPYMQLTALHIEGCVLASYGLPDREAMAPEDIKDRFLGDLSLWLPVIPNNLHFFGGQDPDTTE